MTALILDGKQLATQLQTTIQNAVQLRQSQGLRPPGLAVIRVGDDPASAIYVANKRKLAQAVGFKSYAYDWPAHTTETEVLRQIDVLNHDPNIDGILVQLPLPVQIRPEAVIEHILPTKDVDGFHPYNLGRLAQGRPLLRPCTPYGVIQLLNHYHCPIEGQDALVIGASNIVGRPMALELLAGKATVTVCHRATQDLKKHVQAATILVIATGTHSLVPSDWLHEEHIVVDIGIHRDKNGHIHGDMDFETAKQRVAWITPVPGGIGPMTVSTLLQNTLWAANHHVS